MYSNMYNIGIKIPTRNEGHLQLFDDFVRKVLKLSQWQIRCLQHEKTSLNHILWIRMLGVVLMNSKTHMVVMEVVSQQLDQYRNNDLISKLNEIPVRIDLSMLSCMIFSKSWFYTLTLKLIWYLLDIQGSGSVKLHENWMWINSSFVFYKWDICYWNKQWTVNDIPNFENLIFKLRWMFWVIN